MPISKTRLTTAQAIIKFLQAQYSERDGKERRFIPAVFGIFGHGIVAGIGQALYEYGGDLPYYQPCNEQSMVHTAVGFAKANLRLQTLACTSSIGPGATNMITGAAVATVNRLPVLLMPGDYYATRHQGPVLQQLEHPSMGDVSVNDCFRPVSRFFDRISRPEQVLTALPEAMRILTDPADTGAVVLALPQDVQSHAYDYPGHFFEKRTWRIERRQPDPQRIKEAISLLANAKKPFIIAGGGVNYSEAGHDLKSFAESFGLPVGETCAGKGALPGGSDLWVSGCGVTGTTAAAKLMREADLIIAIGTRLTDFATGSQSAFANANVKFININVVGHDAYKQGALPVLADAREALRALNAAGKAAGLKPNPAYIAEVARLKAEWEHLLAAEIGSKIPGEAMSEGEVVRILNESSRAGDTVVTASGAVPGDLQKMWDCSHGSHCHIEFGYSCMGYELPAGLGVRLAQPDGEVFVIIGDGTFLMNPTELVTAMQEGLKVTVIILNNHGYQVIRQLQMNRVGRSFGNEFRHRDADSNRLEGEYVDIDYARTAEGMGARAWKVKTQAELSEALAEARNERRSGVIVAEIEKHRFGVPGSGIWWDVAPAEVSDDPVTQELRSQYEKDRDALQRFYY